MAAPVGRSEKRFTKMITVELARPDAPQLKETVVTHFENASLPKRRLSPKT
jgi:hypothetical protein